MVVSATRECSVFELFLICAGDGDFRLAPDLGGRAADARLVFERLVDPAGRHRTDLLHGSSEPVAERLPTGARGEIEVGIGNADAWLRRGRLRRGMSGKGDGRNESGLQ